MRENRLVMALAMAFPLAAPTALLLDQPQH